MWGKAGMGWEGLALLCEDGMAGNLDARLRRVTSLCSVLPPSSPPPFLLRSYIDSQARPASGGLGQGQGARGRGPPAVPGAGQGGRGHDDGAEGQVWTRGCEQMSCVNKCG